MPYARSRPASSAGGKTDAGAFFAPLSAAGRRVCLSSGAMLDVGLPTMARRSGSVSTVDPERTAQDVEDASDPRGPAVAASGHDSVGATGGPENGAPPPSAPPRVAMGGYALDRQVGFLLRRAQQRHLSIFAAHMTEGLTAQQFAVLAKIGEVGSESQNALGRMVAMDQSTMNGVVQRLLRRGLVTKSHSAEDRRKLLLRLTREGARVLDRILPRAQDITRLTLAPLSEKDQKKLLALLRQIS